MPISAHRQKNPSSSWRSNLLSPCRHHGAELRVLQSTFLREGGWNATGRGADTHLSLCHDVQVLVVDGEGHVSQHRAPVLEHRHHLVLDPALRRPICPDLQGAHAGQRGSHSSHIPGLFRGMVGRGGEEEDKVGKGINSKISAPKWRGSKEPAGSAWEQELEQRFLLHWSQWDFPNPAEIMRKFCGCKVSTETASEL